MCKVYYEETGKSEPKAHEKRAAELMVRHFKSEIIFLRRRHCSTPDLYVLKTGVRWELKSPEGGSKHTIQNNLRDTDGQSENVVLDLSRIKLTDAQSVSRTREFLRKEHYRTKRIKIILKSGKIIDVKK